MIPEDLLRVPDTEAPANPFPGLRPFEFGERHLYFGRDGQSEQLVRKLRRTRFVAVVGTSGSGKSSLVRAGLLPDLFSGYMPGAGSRWRVALMRPSNDPLGNLARALNAPSVFGSDIEENAEIQAAITEATLRRGSLGLVEAVRQNRMPSNESLLVVVDQFEELFRFASEYGSEQYRYDAAAFVKLLLEASRQREHSVYVVLTMRSDYLGDCSMFWDLPEAINEGQYLIPRLTRDQRTEAIAGPVAVCGGEITQRLVNRLLNDVGDSPDQLPILQHALMRTWENWKGDHAEGEPIDLRHYEAIGRMSEALSLHADEAWNELRGEREQRLAEKIFKALTEKGADNREVRRPAELRSLCLLTEAAPAEVVPVIDAFRREGRSFLMPPAPAPLGPDSLVDISHESLIRNWSRLTKWVDEESVSAQIYRRLAETAVLYGRGEAGLWRDPDLQIALDWRERTRPNAAWAARYHPGFDAAMTFLDESVAARDAARREAEERRRREVNRARVVATVFFLLFMLALLAFGVAYTKTIQAQENSRQLQQALLSLRQANEQARAERDRANEQSAIATRNEAKAREAETDALDKKRQADEAKADALRQAEIAKTNERQAQLAKAEVEKQKVEADRQRATAVAEANRANAATAAATAEAEKNRQLLYAADINLAHQAYEANNIARGRALLEAHGGDGAQGFDWRYLWRLLHQESDTLTVPGGAVNAVALSRDGKTLATAAGDLITLWDAASRQPPPRWVKSGVGHVNSVALSPDKKLLAVGGAEPAVKLTDVETRREVASLEGHTDAVNAVAFSSDGSVLATGGNDHTVRLWDVATRKELAKLERSSFVRAVAFSPDGKEVGASYVNGEVIIWDIASRGLAHVFRHDANVVSIAFSSYGGLLATGSIDGTVKLWVYPVDTELHRFTNNSKPPVSSVAFSADGKELVITYVDGSLRLARVNTTNPLRAVVEDLATLKGHQGSVSAAAFAPDGTLISGSFDGTIKFWDTKARVLEQSPFSGHTSEVASVAFSPDGRLVASAGGDKTLRLWRADTREEVCAGRGGAGAFRSLAFSPDGGVVATGSEVKASDKAAGQAGPVALWDAKTCKQLAALRGHTETVTSVAFSPDGRLLATASRDETVKIWEAATLKEVTTLENFVRPVLAVAFSPDGKALATAAGDIGVELWDVASGKALLVLWTDKSEINSLAFSPARSGRRLLAAGTVDGNVKVWDVGAGQPKELATLKGHKEAVASLAFSSDGRVLSSGSFDSTVKLWSTDSFKELLTLKGHTGAVNSVAFSPDGTVLASGGFDRTVRLWYAATDAEVKSESGKSYSGR
ncbi:MAG TPA: hypothetical protein VN282_12930 [Pyrinomonadaceae bacterium]|nr:hypothetical protein [Pyrinomonadaceae bacterium]